MSPRASTGHELLKNSLLNGHIDFKFNVFYLHTITIIWKNFRIMDKESIKQKVF